MKSLLVPEMMAGSSQRVFLDSSEPSKRSRLYFLFTQPSLPFSLSCVLGCCSFHIRERAYAWFFHSSPSSPSRSCSKCHAFRPLFMYSGLLGGSVIQNRRFQESDKAQSRQWMSLLSSVFAGIDLTVGLQSRYLMKMNVEKAHGVIHSTAGQLQLGAGCILVLENTPCQSVDCAGVRQPKRS